MATNTYVALDKITTTGSVASVTFSSINQGYTDLVIVCNAGAVANSDLSFRVNGDTGSNYSTTNIYGTGTTAGSDRTTNATQGYCTYYGSIETLGSSVHIVQFMNYSNTTTYKTVLARANNASRGVDAVVNLWRNTSAITSITLIGQQQNIIAGSTFSLYGIKAEGVTPAAKATGGAIYSDSTYYYHVFGSTGTFTPLSSLTADVLVVAGGGGGAASSGRGAGGAGGLLSYTSQSLTATGYTCTVGAGGAADASGGNSQFGALTASVGGGFGAGSAARGDNGGSGGSGGGSNYGGTGGAATSGQGNAGGGSTSSANYGGGGGGGSAAVGGTGTTSNGGAGGAGTTSAFINTIGTATGVGQLSSSNYYIAAGGGAGIYSGGTAGAGGVGGAGNGSANTAVGTNGLVATGSGGGGGSQSYNGGSGGSGVVIVRYLKA
jgi:hypothetical protein